ncbi:MAG: DUF1404 domain-containing protein [Sulfolobaceae archaeon]|nr:DUF1404 domain-containing protein [Sulfolobaceae archaeon]
MKEGGSEKNGDNKHSSISSKKYKPLIFSLILIVFTVNPLVEELMNINIIPYMLAHYSLFISGILIGYFYSVLKRSPWHLIPGVALGVLWHLPFFFNLGAIYLYIRIVEEFTLFLGGLLLGTSLHCVNNTVKILLFALWMVGDTYLSALFMISPLSYTRVYPPSQTSITGIIMFLLMNTIVVFILLEYMYRYMVKEEKEFEQKSGQKAV